MTEDKTTELEEILARRLVRQFDVGVGEAGEALNQPAKESDESSSTELEPGATTRNLRVPTTFAKVEKSLISLGFFTPSSRRIKNQRIKRIGFTRSIDGKKVNATAEFHPSPVFGLPITADQDKFLALHQIITDHLNEHGVVTNPVRFTSAELLRRLNKERDSGKNYKDISEWLDVMTTTTIVSNGVVFEAGKQRFARDRFHVFVRAVSVGKEMPDGSIADANYVWLSEWQLENINHKFLLPIDLLTYRELRNYIAKALVPLLQIWLFASQRAGSFEKRYEELCEILSLQVYSAPSRITQQLKASLDELASYGYLEKWRIERTADRRSFKVVFVHGPKFHRDRRRRQLAENLQTKVPIVIAESEPVRPDLPEPEKLDVPLAAVNLTISDTRPSIAADGAVEDAAQEGRAKLESQLVAELSARGLMPATAERLLRSIPLGRLETVFDYIDYWDEAKRTKQVGEGFLYRLVQAGEALPSSFETRKQRLERLEQERGIENLRRKVTAEMRFSVDRAPTQPEGFGSGIES